MRGACHLTVLHEPVRNPVAVVCMTRATGLSVFFKMQVSVLGVCESKQSVSQMCISGDCARYELYQIVLHTSPGANEHIAQQKGRFISRGLAQSSGRVRL
jgi:hypothetical protein